MSRMSGLRSRALSVACVVTVMAVAPASAQVYQSSIFATGLNNARGLAFDSDGALYVAEGGYYIPGGPSMASPEGGTVTLGAGGSITRIFAGVQERIYSGLPSLAADNGSATGPQDITFYNGLGYFVTGFGGNPALRDTDLEGSDLAKGLASLYSFGAGVVTKIADLGAVELDDPNGDGIDSNPFHITSGSGGLFITDAGGNTVLNVDATGAPRVLTTFADIVGPLPFPIDSVPTGITFGPDGKLYVSQLTGGPFPAGGSTVYSIDPVTGDKLAAVTGLTTITDLVFDATGTMFVLQIAADDQFGQGPGSIKRVNADGSLTTVYSGLTMPTGLEIGSDGAFYVTNFSPVAGIGQVLRIAAVPEPATWAMLIIGFAGIGASMRKRGLTVRFA